MGKEGIATDFTDGAEGDILTAKYSNHAKMSRRI
jgi:hypothetical protein